MTCPARPRTSSSTELRYDHGSGFWFAPGVEIVPKGYFVNSAERRDAPTPTRWSTSRLGFEHKPLEPRRVLRGPQPDRRELLSAVASTTPTGASSSRATAARSTAASRGGGNERRDGSHGLARRRSSWRAVLPRHAGRADGSRSARASSYKHSGQGARGAPLRRRAVASAPDGVPLIAWAAQEGHDQPPLRRAHERRAPTPVRVNPAAI